MQSDGMELAKIISYMFKKTRSSKEIEEILLGLLISTKNQPQDYSELIDYLVESPDEREVFSACYKGNTEKITSFLAQGYHFTLTHLQLALLSRNIAALKSVLAALNLPLAFFLKFSKKY